MKLLLAFSFSILLLSACNFFGGQVQINEKSTVKFQGAGVSQKDAQRLGQFLLQQGYFNTFDQRTVYLRKKNSQFEVKFIVNKELLTNDSVNLLAGFQIWHQWINEEVFPSTSTRLILADQQLQTLHTIDPKASTYQ